MIRRASRRLALRARAVEMARAQLDELAAELGHLNEELDAELARTARPTARAQAVLAWGRRSADALIAYAEASGDDLAAWDGTAQLIVDTLCGAVSAAVPAMLAEEAPELAAECVQGLTATILDAVKAEGTPLAAAVPVLAAVLSWQTAVFDAVARLDAQALRRLSILAPYPSARALAALLGGAVGGVVDACASRLICRTIGAAELAVHVATHRANRCRRRGPPAHDAATPASRHVVGTSPNAPPSACVLGALKGPLSACGRSRRRTVPI